MQIEISVLFSVVIALIGVWATFIKINRDNKKDREERVQAREKNIEKQTERHVETIAQLNNLGQMMQTMALDVKSMDKKVDELDRRVTIVEESSKSAHKRIDEVKNTCEARSL